MRFAQRTTAPHPRAKGEVATWRGTRLGLARSGCGGGKEKGASLRSEATAAVNASAMAGEEDGRRPEGRARARCACAPADKSGVYSGSYTKRVHFHHLLDVFVR